MTYHHKESNMSKTTHYKANAKRKSVRFVLPDESSQNVAIQSKCDRSLRSPKITTQDSFEIPSLSSLDSRQFQSLEDSQQMEFHMGKNMPKLPNKGAVKSAKKTTKGKCLTRSYRFQKERNSQPILTVKTLQNMAEKKKNKDNSLQKGKGSIKTPFQSSKEKRKEKQKSKKKEKIIKQEKKRKQQKRSKSMKQLNLKQIEESKQIILQRFDSLKKAKAAQQQMFTLSGFKGFKLSNDGCLVYQLCSMGEGNKKKETEIKCNETSVLSNSLKLQILKSYLLQNSTAL